MKAETVPISEVPSYYLLMTLLEYCTTDSNVKIALFLCECHKKDKAEDISSRIQLFKAAFS